MKQEMKKLHESLKKLNNKLKLLNEKMDKSNYKLGNWMDLVDDENVAKEYYAKLGPSDKEGPDDMYDYLKKELKKHHIDADLSKYSKKLRSIKHKFISDLHREKEEEIDLDNDIRQKIKYNDSAWLHEQFDIFNDKYFAGRLKPISLMFHTDLENDAYGMYVSYPDLENKKFKPSQIIISTKVKNYKDFRDVLVHEMIHYYDQCIVGRSEEQWEEAIKTLLIYGKQESERILDCIYASGKTTHEKYWKRIQRTLNQEFPELCISTCFNGTTKKISKKYDKDELYFIIFKLKEGGLIAYIMSKSCIQKLQKVISNGKGLELFNGKNCNIEYTKILRPKHISSIISTDQIIDNIKNFDEFKEALDTKGLETYQYHNLLDSGIVGNNYEQLGNSSLHENTTDIDDKDIEEIIDEMDPDEIEDIIDDFSNTPIKIV